MRFKIDENLPSELVEILREAGHDGTTVLEQKMGGEADPALAVVCREEERALVTLDVGFADIRTYRPREHRGLLVLRLKRQDKDSVLRVFLRILPLLHREPLDRQLWIVDEERVRIRS